MSKETVSDIMGKGLKFENRTLVQVLPAEKLAGTIPALIGGARWGKLGPQLVRRDFSAYYGAPIIPNDSGCPDFSGLALDYHLKYSQLGYFTRITDGTDTPASRVLRKDANVAKFVGGASIQNTSVTVRSKTSTSGYKNNEFTLVKDGKVKTIEIPASLSASAIVDIKNLNVANHTGKNIMFSVDGILVVYTITGIEADIVAKLQEAIMTKLGVSSDVSKEYIYSLPLSEISGEFANNDIIRIAGAFHKYDGTEFQAYTATDVIVNPIPNPADLGYAWNDAANTAHVFTKAATGSYATATMFASAESDIVPLTFGSDGQICRLTAANGGLLPGLIKTNGTAWAQECLAADLKLFAGAPAVVADGSYYNTVSGILIDFDYATNLNTTLSFQVIKAVVFKSKEFGKSSKIVIHNFPGSAYTEDNVFSVSGSDTPVNGIIASINAGLKVDVPAVSSVGLYLKAAAAWGAPITATLSGAVPVSPTNNQIWKSDGTNILFPLGFYKYDSATVKWVSLGAVQNGTTIPEASVGADGEYFEVSAQPAITDVVVGFDEYGRFIVMSTQSGESQSFVIPAVTGNRAIYSTLEINTKSLSVACVGTDEELGGILEAVCTGDLGNTIFMYLDNGERGDTLSVYFNSYLVGTFSSFSYEVDSQSFIGDMIAANLSTSKYVKLVPEVGATRIPAFEQKKSLYLTGGTSGVSGLEDYMYVIAADEYKNIDLYTVDIIGCPGIVGETVVDALTKICEYRKDCCVVIDPPQSMSPFLVEKWHNGETDLRTQKLDTEFGAVFYPWLLIPVNSQKNPKIWAPPSTRVIGAIGNCDFLTQNKYSPVAGHKVAQISEVEALEIYLKEEEKGRLYEDALQNNINPIVYSKNFSYYIDGNKTTKKGRTPINRLSNMRIAFFIKRIVADIAPNYYWMPITSRTRASFATELATLIFRPLAAAQFIEANYVIDVSDILNDETVEAQKGMIASMEWSPINRLEKIKVISTMKGKEVAFELQL